LAKYFGDDWEKYWQKYEENFQKRIEAIKNRYKSTISEEDADIIIYLLNNVKRMIEK
jgi:hypothetical protein